jgi:hypothetical protein
MKMEDNRKKKFLEVCKNRKRRFGLNKWSKIMKLIVKKTNKYAFTELYLEVILEVINNILYYIIWTISYIIL